jgi:hypothetical protein
MNDSATIFSKTMSFVADGSTAPMAPADLLSRLPLEECCERLRAGLGSPWTLGTPFALLGGKTVLGRLKGTTLRARKRIAYSNSFQTRLTAVLSEQSGQTLIQCRFGLPASVIAFFSIWVLLVGIISLGVIVATVSEALTDPAQFHQTNWLGTVIPIVFPAFGLALIRFGRRLARGERAFLIDFVRNATDARPIS